MSTAYDAPDRPRRREATETVGDDVRPERSYVVPASAGPGSTWQRTTRRRDAAEPIVNESHYHSKKDRVFVRAIQGHYNLKEELARLRVDAARAQGTSRSSSSTGRRPSAVTTSSRRTASRRRSTSTWRNTVRAANRRSTATSTRRRSTSSTARATRSTTACATTGRPATSRSCTTTACTSTSTPTRRSRRARS